jgi:hypothetical protein
VGTGIQVFKRIHNAYLTLVSNPFYSIDDTTTITSKRFVEAVDSLAGTSAGPAPSILSR